MLAGEIPGTVDVLADLRAAGVRLVALSNWSAEMFPVARERFDFLAWFEGIVISGDVGVNKPDRRIFDHLAEQFGIEPEAALFIDDSSANVDAAKALGFRAISSPTLRRCGANWCDSGSFLIPRPCRLRDSDLTASGSSRARLFS